MNGDINEIVLQKCGVFGLFWFWLLMFRSFLEMGLWFFIFLVIYLFHLLLSSSSICVICGFFFWLPCRFFLLLFLVVILFIDCAVIFFICEVLFCCDIFKDFFYCDLLVLFGSYCEDTNGYETNKRKKVRKN